MNFGQIARLLAAFLLFFSLFLLVPFVVSFYETPKLGLQTRLAFGVALGTGLLTAGLLRLGGMRVRKELFRREGLAVVVLSWVLAAALAAIPLKWSGAIPDPVDAFFESISGMTTTGATVLGTDNPRISALPTSILLWRAMLQWIGGIGIVLVFIVLLPAMGVTGSRLLSSEQVGMSDESDRPRMSARARRIFLIYAALTAMAFIGYLVAGLSGFDALCHALTTLATGGFSNNDVSIAGYDNLGVELVAIVFMFAAGCNFLFLVRMAIRGPSAKNTSLLQSIEFRYYAAITMLVSVAAALSLWTWGGQFHDASVDVLHDYSDFGRCLRDATFQTVSILTTTGYASTNFDGWPKVALYLLILCMFIGGCTGSTAGGFKVLRIVVCSKLLGYALRQFVRPRSVETLKLGPTPLANNVVSAILTLLLLWMVMVAAGTLVLDMDPRLDMVSAFAASLSMMGCVGPAISPLDATVDLGPYGGYGELQTGAKLFMSLQMLFGRLEILAPLAFLTPGFWRR